MAYTCKNYSTDGGDKLVIGGTLKIESGATVEGVVTAAVVDNLTTADATKALSAKQGKALNDAKIAIAAIVNDITTGGVAVPLSAEQGKVLGGRVAANQADSTATEVAGLVTDFNALLAKLKAAGLMTADA